MKELLGQKSFSEACRKQAEKASCNDGEEVVQSSNVTKHVQVAINDTFLNLDSVCEQHRDGESSFIFTIVDKVRVGHDVEVLDYFWLFHAEQIELVVKERHSGLLQL